MKFKPNSKTKRILKKFSEFVNATDNNFFYVVMGGIAIDGYTGKLTRNHPDVDMLVFREDLKKAENILEELGYFHKRFTRPDETSFVYKMQTGDENHVFSFQVLDQVGDDKFGISFYRDPHMEFPMSFIKPPTWLTLESTRFPSVSKEFLIRLKENEITFFEKLKKEGSERYRSKRKNKHLKCLHDIKLLKSL